MNIANKALTNKLLKEFTPKSPVVFAFHINRRVYEHLGLRQYEYIRNSFLLHNLNVEFLPILTDHNTYIENRLKQFKKGLERIVDKHERKVHVIGYSYAGILPRGYIAMNNGEDLIHSVLTIATPNQGSRLIDLLISHDLETKWHRIEPGLRSTGGDRDWLLEEYSSKSIYDYNNISPPSSEVKYMSVGGRKLKIKCSESIRFSAEEISKDNDEEHPNDGLVTIKESEYGQHLINVDADHFEIMGMKSNFNSRSLFELYANAIKSSDPDFNHMQGRISI